MPNGHFTKPQLDGGSMQDYLDAAQRGVQPLGIPQATIDTGGGVDIALSEATGDIVRRPYRPQPIRPGVQTWMDSGGAR